MPQVQENPSVNINAKSIAKYTLLPGIFPRLQRLAQHLSQFLFMFTQIFGSFGLIDKNHPCLKPENIGLYRFRDIVGLAASNVVFDRKHIPQIIMFFTVMMSIVITAAIFVGFIASLLVQIPEAQAQLFGTPQGTNIVQYGGLSQDWAMNFLYRIFGDAGIFPTPQDKNLGNGWFRMIMGGMLRYYSLALLVIAALMMLYILVITVTESARTGKPFSARFDGIWAPVRLALAIGMLMPISSGGYNGAQLMVLQSAVWGSNLATNVWYGGLKKMENDSEKFFSTMMGDPGYRFVRDIFLVNLCVAGLQAQKEHKTLMGDDVEFSASRDGGNMVFTFGTDNAPDFCGQVVIKVKTEASQPPSLKGQPYWPDKVIEGYGNILGRFLPVGKYYAGGAVDDMEPIVSGPTNVMADFVNHAVQKSFNVPEGKPVVFAKNVNKKYRDGSQVQSWMNTYWRSLGIQYYCGSQFGTYSNNIPKCTEGDTVKRTLLFHDDVYSTSIKAYNNWILTSMANDAQFGWTTAGVFYLRISMAFGAISDIVNNVPVVTKLPSNLTKPFATEDNPSANTEVTKEQCSSWWESLKNVFGGGDEICAKYKMSLKMNAFLRGGKDWFRDSVKGDEPVYSLMETESFDRALELAEPDSATNVNTSTVTAPVLGGLASMAQIDSKDMNPLGVIVSWGNLMMNLGLAAFIIGFAGNGRAWTDIAFSLGATLLVPGFILAFWIPTVPFMHFVFAVIEWMVSVMEAVIGMPLWALSLITLEGDGLGKLGMAGIKRIFEIVLRPTIIILSLVASILIFTAGVSFFNSALALYGEAKDNVTSMWMAPVQAFGMLFVYMFGIYSLANACFKLIDTIPDNFGRWMGLEKGFGGNMKSGFSELSGLIVGGAAMKGLTDMGQGIGKTQKVNRQKKS